MTLSVFHSPSNDSMNASHKFLKRTRAGDRAGGFPSSGNGSVGGVESKVRVPVVRVVGADGPRWAVTVGMPQDQASTILLYIRSTDFCIFEYACKATVVESWEAEEDVEI